MLTEPLAHLAQLTSKVLTADQVVAPYIHVLYVSFDVTFLLTPVFRMVTTYYGVIDEPDLVRTVHKAPTAYLGGVAMFLGILCALAISQHLPLHRIQPGWP